MVYELFFGGSVAGLENIPYSPWLYSVLVIVMLINIASVWLRSYSTGRMTGFYLASAGTAVIVGSTIWPGGRIATFVGVALMLTGSLLSAMNVGAGRFFKWNRSRWSRTETHS